MNLLIEWLIIVLVSMLIEALFSPGLYYFLSFSLGALIAAVSAWFGMPIVYQLLIFVFGTSLSFIFLSFFIKRISRDTLHKSNVYALQGKRGTVTESISNCKRGWIKIEGELWAAASVEYEIIEVGDMVEVVGNAGSHLKVKKVKASCMRS